MGVKKQKRPAARAGPPVVTGEHSVGALKVACHKIDSPSLRLLLALRLVTAPYGTSDLPIPDTRLEIHRRGVAHVAVSLLEMLKWLNYWL